MRPTGFAFLVLFIVAAPTLYSQEDVAPARTIDSPPSVDAILDRYVSALGGKEAIEKLTTRVRKGRVTILRSSYPIVIVSALLMMFPGCRSAYDVVVINGQAHLQFSQGDEIRVGDVFVLYKYIDASYGRPSPPQHKKKVGRIRVTRIIDKTHAAVEVVEGNIELGLKAEKINEGK